MIVIINCFIYVIYLHWMRSPWLWNYLLTLIFFCPYHKWILFFLVDTISSFLPLYKIIWVKWSHFIIIILMICFSFHSRGLWLLWFRWFRWWLWWKLVRLLLTRMSGNVTYINTRRLLLRWTWRRRRNLKAPRI